MIIPEAMIESKVTRRMQANFPFPSSKRLNQ